MALQKRQWKTVRHRKSKSEEENKDDPDEVSQPVIQIPSKRK